jgi:hypothetical protein
MRKSAVSPAPLPSEAAEAREWPKSRELRNSRCDGPAGPNEPSNEVVRQQWNFSPDGSTSESEDYIVDLTAVSILELTIDPDRRGEALAKLADWRLG